ncbi:type II secretion system protein [Psychrobium sp. nBUS_13]|uniref:type II secretion system protein n=1 Tax=Psychrobium sp. nBUS_13 TaxID=3395319 RepID=UPI003EBC4215
MKFKSTFGCFFYVCILLRKVNTGLFYRDLLLLQVLDLKTTDRSLTKGFTLIELILVIMLLGVLATAAPKLIDVQGEARAAVINYIAGTLKSTSDLVHYRALIAGETSPNMTNFYINGRQVRLFYGYVSPGTINQVLDINRRLELLLSVVHIQSGIKVHPIPHCAKQDINWGNWGTHLS